MKTEKIRTKYFFLRIFLFLSQITSIIIVVPSRSLGAQWLDYNTNIKTKLSSHSFMVLACSVCSRFRPPFHLYPPEPKRYFDGKIKIRENGMVGFEALFTNVPLRIIKSSPTFLIGS